MYIIRKFILFIFIFSVLFFSLHFLHIIPIKSLQENLNGISWLYSTIALIFSIISAFVIQNQWNRWTSLEIAVKGEIDALWELIIFAEQLPFSQRHMLQKSIKEYLVTVSNEDWEIVTRELYPKDTEITLRNLQREIKSIPDKKAEAEVASSIFIDIITNRNNRLHYGTGNLPFLLYILIATATFLVIFLSLFIAVNNVVIDYIFTLSIAFLTFLIFTIIDDLNHPFKKGGWHITSKKYKTLLDKINT